MFQHCQMVCRIYCIDTVCLVYFWKKVKQQSLALLLVICGGLHICFNIGAKAALTYSSETNDRDQ